VGRAHGQLPPMRVKERAGNPASVGLAVREWQKTGRPGTAFVSHIQIPEA
jgi:hypothetical protein